MSKFMTMYQYTTWLQLETPVVKWRLNLMSYDLTLSKPGQEYFIDR